MRPCTGQVKRSPPAPAAAADGCTDTACGASPGSGKAAAGLRGGITGGGAPFAGGASAAACFGAGPSSGTMSGRALADEGGGVSAVGCGAATASACGGGVLA